METLGQLVVGAMVVLVVAVAILWPMAWWVRRGYRTGRYDGEATRVMVTRGTIKVPGKVRRAKVRLETREG